MLNDQIFLHQSPGLTVDGIPVEHLLAMRALKCSFIFIVHPDFVREPAFSSELKEHTLMAHDSLAMAALGHGVRVQALASAAEHSQALILHLAGWNPACHSLRCRQCLTIFDIVKLEALQLFGDSFAGSYRFGSSLRFSRLWGPIYLSEGRHLYF